MVDFRWLPIPPQSFHTGMLGGTLHEPRQFAELVASLVRELTSAPKTAALVLPDSWIRLAFAPGGDLPAPGPQRDEALRFKLRRLVPFRVDDLRVSGVEVPSLGEGPPRVLLGFGLEALLAQVEEAFRAAGVSLGLLTSASLAALGALATEPEAEQLTALALVDADSYTMVFARGGVPVLYRHKVLTAELESATQGSLVSRDLRLTRSFIEEQLPGSRLSRVLLVAPPEEIGPWQEWLARGLETTIEPLGRGHLNLVEGPQLDLRLLTPLLGASLAEVA